MTTATLAAATTAKRCRRRLSWTIGRRTTASDWPARCVWVLATTTDGCRLHCYHEIGGWMSDGWISANCQVGSRTCMLFSQGCWG